MFHWYYVNDYSLLHHAVVCWVTAVGIRAYALTLGLKNLLGRSVGWIVTIVVILSKPNDLMTCDEYAFKDNLVIPKSYA